MTPAARHRDTGIDAVRGQAMWMIVVSHFALWFYTRTPERYWLSLPCQMIALPIFFFLSARMHVHPVSWRKLGRRTVRFLILTIVGTTLFALALGLTLHQTLEPEYLFFWFFIALIIFEAAGAGIRHLTQSVLSQGRRVAIALILMTLTEALFFMAYRFMPSLPIIPLFDLRNLWPCYALGLLCTIAPPLAYRLRSITAFISACIILTAAFIFSNATGDKLFLIGTAGAVIASCRLSEWMQHARVCAAVGRQALWVYIVHPFALILLYHIAGQPLETLTATPWAVYAVCIAGAAILSAVIGWTVNCLAMWIKKHKFAVK